MKEEVQVRHVFARLEAWLLLALLLASFVLRVALVRADRIVRWDEPDYLILGRNLVTGHGYTVSGQPDLHYPPLFPLTTGLLYLLTGDMKLGSDICFVVFGTLVLLPFYWLVKRLFGARVAVIAAVLLCFFPALTASVLFWGTMIEPLYLFLLYGALCALWIAWDRGATLNSGKSSTMACLASGILFGLAYLTKPEATVYVGLMSVLLLLANLWRRGWEPAFRLPLWRIVIGLLVLLLAFVAVVSPYFAYIYRHTGRFMVTGKLGVTYVAGEGAVERDPGLYDRALSQLDEAGEEIIWFSADRFKYSIWSLVKSDPLGFLRRTWRNVNTLESLLFRREVFPFYLLILVSLGLFGSAWSRERLIKELFLLAIVAPVGIFLPFHIELRYFAPMLPVFLLWVAKGVVAFADWLQSTWSNLSSRTPRHLSLGLSCLICSLLVLYFLVLQPRVVSDGLAGLNTSRRAAGLWLKANSPAGALVMSRDTEVPFYAERRWTATPNEDYERFIAYVRKRGANYLVVDEREVTVIRPQLALLLNENAPPAGLRHVHTALDPRGKTIVYEVLY